MSVGDKGTDSASILSIENKSIQVANRPASHSQKAIVRKQSTGGQLVIQENEFAY